MFSTRRQVADAALDTVDIDFHLVSFLFFLFVFISTIEPCRGSVESSPSRFQRLFSTDRPSIFISFRNATIASRGTTTTATTTATTT